MGEFDKLKKPQMVVPSSSCADRKFFKKFNMKESVQQSESSSQSPSERQGVAENEPENKQKEAVVPIVRSGMDGELQAMRREMMSCLAAEKEARTALSRRVYELSNELNHVKMEREADARRMIALEDNLLRVESQLHQKRSWHLVNVAPPIIQPIHTTVHCPAAVVYGPPPPPPLPEVAPAVATAKDEERTRLDKPITPSTSVTDDNASAPSTSTAITPTTSDSLSNAVRQLEDEILALCDTFGTILCANLPRQYSFRYNKKLDFHSLGFLRMSQMLAKMSRIQVSGDVKAQVRRRIFGSMDDDDDVHHISSDESASDAAIKTRSASATSIDNIHDDIVDSSFLNTNSSFLSKSDEPRAASSQNCAYEENETVSVYANPDEQTEEEVPTPSGDEAYQKFLIRRVEVLEKNCKDLEFKLRLAIKHQSPPTWRSMRQTLPF